jgi:hypothetical protein
MTYSDTSMPPRLVGAIRSYLGSRTIQRPVSIDRMLRTARRALPDLVVSDDELAELIARELIHEGADVDFDHVAQEHELEPERLDANRPWKDRVRHRCE